MRMWLLFHFVIPQVSRKTKLIKSSEMLSHAFQTAVGKVSLPYNLARKVKYFQQMKKKKKS